MTNRVNLTTYHDNRLRELVNRAAMLTGRARRARLDPLMHRSRSIGLTLHAARDILDQEGPDFIDAASAFISSAERMLTDLDHEITHAGQTRLSTNCLTPEACARTAATINAYLHKIVRQA